MFKKLIEDRLVSLEREAQDEANNRQLLYDGAAHLANSPAEKSFNMKTQESLARSRVFSARVRELQFALSLFQDLDACSNQPIDWFFDIYQCGELRSVVKVEDSWVTLDTCKSVNRFTGLYTPDSKPLDHPLNCFNVFVRHPFIRVFIELNLVFSSTDIKNVDTFKLNLKTPISTFLEDMEGKFDLVNTDKGFLIVFERQLCTVDVLLTEQNGLVALTATLKRKEDKFQLLTL